MGSLWQGIRTRMVSERFSIQLRVKENTGEDDDERDFIWWIRVRWMPPLIEGKSTTPSASRGTMRSKAGVPHGGGFAQLQQLLLEGRNAVTKRRNEIEMASVARAASTAPAGGPMLPFGAFGR